MKAILAVILAGAALAAPQREPIGRLQSPIDNLFATWDAKDSPGCSLGVFQNGAMAYARGYGSASLEHGVPISPESVFYAGSVSKQFTAMAAALAMQQGKLAYADPIRKYLPELPAYADAIEVRHLLHHTSGLRDYNTLLTIAGRRDEDAWDNRAVLRITARQRALNFAPGAEYLYSNTGYTLLATIVERATGTPFAEFADRHIFKPLGMSASHFHVDVRRLVPGRALGYSGRAGQWRLDTPLNERAGAGGLYTTIPDLLKWDENFYTGKVGGSAVLKQLQTRGLLDGGKLLPYAWGLQLAEYRGQPIVEHSGSLGGYRAHVLRFAEQHTSVALLCNASSITPATLVRRVADLVLASRFTEPVPAPRGGGVAGSIPGRVPDDRTAQANREYAGTYYSDELEATFTISASGDQLRLQRENDAVPVVLQTSGPEDAFSAFGMSLRFQRHGGGPIAGFIVDAGRVRGIAFVRK